MRIAVSAGHNVYTGKYFDSGATNPPHVEADINKETVRLLIPMLLSQGHEVLDVTPYNEKFPDSKAHHVLRCKRVDEFKADIFIDVHINAGGGTGVETWVYSKSSKAYPDAVKITDNIAKGMGLFNRGVKEKPGFWSVSLCEAPAMIIEGAFIDNIEDMQKLTPEKYAEAIAKCFGEVKKEGPITVVEDKLYRVQVGAFRIKDNANKLVSDLKKSGFSGYIVEDKVNFPVEVKEVVKTEYYETKEGLKVIETDIDNVYVATLPGVTLRQFGIYGTNGTWQDTANAKDSKSIWGLAVNGNKELGPNSYTNSPKGFKRGTIIAYEDGGIEVARINNTREIKGSVKWTIGGGMLIPDYDPAKEGFTAANNAADVLRNTAHTSIGYKGNRVFLIVHPGCSMVQFRDMILKFGLEGAIFLDGGGSTQMNYVGDKGIKSSRKLSHGIFIKKGGI